MNRREFFRRTLPAVAVTATAVQCGWSLDGLRRALHRVLRRCEEADVERVFDLNVRLQASEAIRALANAIDQYIIGKHLQFWNSPLATVAFA